MGVRIRATIRRHFKCWRARRRRYWHDQFMSWRTITCLMAVVMIKKVLFSPARAPMLAASPWLQTNAGFGGED